MLLIVSAQGEDWAFAQLSPAFNQAAMAEIPSPEGLAGVADLAGIGHRV